MNRLKATPILTSLLAGSLLFNVIGCQQIAQEDSQKVLVSSKDGKSRFADYWYAGQAELNTYQVEQSRYGEMREGKAVMVFVTEDFSKSKHVKLDNPEKDWKDKVSVMKLNFVKRFVTGIYDYSMMLSAFTPVDLENYPHSLKTTTTSQDWCGQSFVQMNLKGNDYKVQLRSYFESEGDKDFSTGGDLLEDELWNRIRINPQSIQPGEMDLVPSTLFSRLKHESIRPRRARIRLEQSEAMNRLIVEYMHLDRTVIIGYEPQFPYHILAWEEQDEGKLSSKGTLLQSIKAPYWTQHDNDDLYLRDSLRLPKTIF
jgi:hypothetical protein